MISAQSKTKLGGLILAFFVILGVSAISATTTQAQWRRDDQNRDRDYRRNRDADDDRDDRYDRRDRRDRRDYRNDRYSRNRDYRYDPYNRNNGGYGRNGNYGYDVYQAALNQGYQAGLNTGANDAQRGQSYNPQRSHYWRNPPSYDSYGNRGQSQQAFREGFVRGYAEGYRQYGGRYNRGGGYSRFPW